MKTEEAYVTVRIPRKLADEIDEILRSGTLGYRSRAEMVNEAIRLRIELLRFNNPTISRTTPQKTDDDLSVQVKETLLAHTIINMAKEKTPPPYHSDPKQLEQHIRRYITKRAKQEGKKITKKYLDELTKDLLKYNQGILKGLALMTRD